MKSGSTKWPPPCANDHWSTQYEQSFRHNHTLIRKLLQTNIPDTIIKFIANYIKGRKAYTTYRNYTSRYRQFKTGVPQVGVLSPTLFNIYISDLPPPSASVQVMAYTIDITITYTHRSEANKYIHPYLQKVFVWTKQAHTKSRQNYLHYVHAGPCRIYKQSGPKNTEQCTTHGNTPKGSGSYLRPILTYSTYSTHIHNISVLAHNPLQIIKALAAT